MSAETTFCQEKLGHKSSQKIYTGDFHQRSITRIPAKDHVQRCHAAPVAYMAAGAAGSAMLYNATVAIDSCNSKCQPSWLLNRFPMHGSKRSSPEIFTKNLQQDPRQGSYQKMFIDTYCLHGCGGPLGPSWSILPQSPQTTATQPAVRVGHVRWCM